MVSLQFILANAAIAVLIMGGGFIAERVNLTATAVIFGVACILLSVWVSVGASGFRGPRDRGDVLQKAFTRARTGSSIAPTGC